MAEKLFEELDEDDWERPPDWLMTGIGWALFLGALAAIGIATWILTTPESRP